ncbi:MAG: hypothetical protein HC840_04930 [Leptolyngbyaceae cyanobacterium RM2_2_4]|nr:hypothetical protein [Leptolyngbyaceae cyanobacterium RM2_2_4]
MQEVLEMDFLQFEFYWNGLNTVESHTLAVSLSDGCIATSAGFNGGEDLQALRRLVDERISVGERILETSS